MSFFNVTVHVLEGGAMSEAAELLHVFFLSTVCQLEDHCTTVAGNDVCDVSPYR